ncbi:MAG TPA: hypothetical protein VJT14_12545 [Candidatus Dormibacteraeota bacterium]|nr:hypothetical protein [Candidatus Dormibacteraeota bacterium]
MAVARRQWSAEPADRPTRVVPSGWRWPAVFTAVMCLLTLPPILIAALRAPVGSAFPGYVVIARDAYVYQSMWRAGWHGAWLFQPAYTAESLPGILLYPWYLWPAHLIGWATGPWLYHLSRLAAAAALLMAVTLLTRELFRPRVLRRWAFVLCALGGGIGTLLPRDVRIGPLTSHATEMSSPGSSVADLISMAPHLSWALALMCWTMVVALRASPVASGASVPYARLRRLWVTGLLAVLGLQLIYPQLALLTVAVVGGWSVSRRRRRALWFTAALALIQLPYLGYLLWVWQTSPTTLRVIRSSLEVGDLFGFLVLSHLVASGLILIALLSRRLRGDLLLPAFWIAGMTLFMFAPGISGTLGRSFMASSVPFGLCAAPGLLVVLRRLRTVRWRRRVLAITLVASSFYGIFSLAQPYWIAAFRLDPRAEYESHGEAAVLARLEPYVSARDVVLTTYLDGIFVPAQTSARAFNGHPEMTIDARRKSDEALAFFTTLSAARRAAFLRANGVDYVLTTDPAFAARLAPDPALEMIDFEDATALFRVRP